MAMPVGGQMTGALGLTSANCRPALAARTYAAKSPAWIASERSRAGKRSPLGGASSLRQARDGDDNQARITAATASPRRTPAAAGRCRGRTPTIWLRPEGRAIPLARGASSSIAASRPRQRTRRSLSGSCGECGRREIVFLIEPAEEQQRRRFEQALGAERLFEKRLAFPEQRAFGEQGVGVAGDEEHLHIGFGYAEAPCHFVTRQFGHVEIGNEQVERSALRDRVAGLLWIPGFFDDVTRGLEHAADDVSHRRLVVDDDDARCLQILVRHVHRLLRCLRHLRRMPWL